jgi:transcriptional regulator with XRE-family HTH domain
MTLAKKALKNNLQPLREARGWSQEALAARIGTTGPQINRLEKGQRKLSVEWLLRLCAAFNVSADKIVNIPLSKVNTSTADPAMLGLVVGWLLEACDKYKIEQDPKEIGKWTSYVYNDASDKDLDFKAARALAFRIVKLGQRKKDRHRRL